MAYVLITETSWWSGQVPDDWKNANVTPIFNEGKRRIQVATQASLLSLGKLQSKSPRSHCQPHDRLLISRMDLPRVTLVLWTRKGKAANVVRSAFRIAFDSASSCVHEEKLGRYGLDKRIWGKLGALLDSKASDQQYKAQATASYQQLPSGIHTGATTIYCLY